MALREKFIELRKYAESVLVGCTDRSRLCPFCEGGTSRETAFSVTRTDAVTIKYCCHRATCAKAGTVACWGQRLSSSPSAQPTESVFTPRVYRGDTGELDNQWLSALYAKYGLNEVEVNRAGWRLDIANRDLVVPVRSPLGVLRGVETRLAPWLRNQKRGLERPKSKSYQELDEVWLGWFRDHRTGPIVLLEDVISALKVSRHFQVCSLMGTHLSVDKVREIRYTSGGDGNEVILALDKDATDKAHHYIKEWGLILGNFRAVELSKDMKFSTDEEIKEIISGV